MSATKSIPVPKSIDIPAKSRGYVVREVARATIYTSAPHRKIAPSLPAFVTAGLALAPDAPLAYRDEDGDEISADRAAILAHVEAVAAQAASPIRPVSAAGAAASVAGNATIAASLDRPSTEAAELHVGAAGDPHAFAIALHAARDGGAGRLSIVFPRERLYRDPDGVAATFAALLAAVPFASGTLGLALFGNGQKCLPLQRTYAALDVASAAIVALDLGERVAGIGWLTAIGGEALEELGGEDDLRAALAPLLADGRVTISRVGEGILARLGAVAVRGAKTDDTSAYRALATLLAASDVLHVPQRALYMAYDGAYAQDFRQRAMVAQSAWHLRFVDKA